MVFAVELAFDARPSQRAEGICDLICANGVCNVTVRRLNTGINAMSVIKPRTCFVTLESVQGSAICNFNGAQLLDR